MKFNKVAHIIKRILLIKIFNKTYNVYINKTKIKKSKNYINKRKFRILYLILFIIYSFFLLL